MRLRRGRLLDAYRATGADVIGGEPASFHGAAFEGYFWRIVEPRSGSVVVALCAVCRVAGDMTTRITNNTIRQ